MPKGRLLRWLAARLIALLAMPLAAQETIRQYQFAPAAFFDVMENGSYFGKIVIRH